MKKNFPMLFLMWLAITLACTLPAASAPPQSATSTPRPQATATATSHPPTATPTPIIRLRVLKDIGNWTLASHSPSPKTTGFIIDPSDGARWYANAPDGIYLSTDSGQTWRKTLETKYALPVIIDAREASLCYAVGDNTFYLSRDKGETWQAVHSFGSDPRTTPSSFTVSALDSRIYVPFWDAKNNRSGVYISTDYGAHWEYRPLEADNLYLRFWDIQEDPRSGYVFLAAEIGNHPEPYHPPFFRSTDRGQTWENIADTFPVNWHSQQIEIADDMLYVSMEGDGLYRTPLRETQWETLLSFPFGVTYLFHPENPAYFFFSNGISASPLRNGGVFFTIDSGRTYWPIGLENKRVIALQFDPQQTKLYALPYGDDIYVKPIR